MPLSFLENFRVSRFFSKATAMLLILTFIVTLYQCSYSTQTNPNIVITKSDSSPLYQPATVEQKVALSLGELALSTEDAHLRVSNEIANSTVNDADKSLVDKAFDKVGLNDLAGADLAVFKAYREQADTDKQEALQSFETVKDHLTQNNLAPVIFDRHEAAVEQYKAKHAELVGLLDGLLASRSLQEQDASLESLNSWLKENQTQKAHQQEDFDNLPFNSPSPEVREPDLNYTALYERVVTPQLLASTSFDSSMVDSSVSDLAETIDAPHTDAIKDLAAELNNDPIAIYDWVYNNIKFIPSYGSIQGAEYTLKLRQGNAMDTSSLLIALLRSSNIHARYAYGTVEVPIEKVMNWVGGVNSPEAAANLMGQGGIPSTMMISGGEVISLRFEHTWVETFVDFEPSRGLKNIEADSWIPLDASFKQYEFNTKKDFASQLSITPEEAKGALLANSTSNEQEGWIQGVDLIAFESLISSASLDLKLAVEQGGDKALLQDFYGAKDTQIIPYGPLSSALPYKLLAQTESFNEVPDQLRHKFIFKLTSPSGDDIDVEKATVELAGKKIALNFVPETAEDKEVIRSYFPEGNTTNKSLPAYLIKMYAKLSINDIVVDQAHGYTMGMQTTSTMGTWSPSHGWRKSNNNPTVGETHVISVDLQGVSVSQSLSLADKMKKRQSEADVLKSIWAEENNSDLLYATILSYFQTNNFYDKVDGYNSDIINYRSPSYGVFQTLATASYWFDVPREIKLTGLVMDVDNISTTSTHSKNDKAKVNAFRSAAGSRMSLLENVIPEHVFSTGTVKKRGISTTQAFIYALEEGQKLFTLTQANSAQLENITLNSLAKNEIYFALLTGKTVTVHEKPLNVSGWVGSGYLITDEWTGSAAYKIAGGFNGGSIPIDDPALLVPDSEDGRFKEALDEVLNFGDWLLNHSAESIPEYWGEDSPATYFWDFFAADFIQAANDTIEGDYSDAVLNAALAIVKVKLAEKAFEVGGKLLDKIPIYNGLKAKVGVVTAAVSGKVFDSIETANAKIQELVNKFSGGKIPDGAVIDPNYPGRLQVDIGDGKTATVEYNAKTQEVEVVEFKKSVIESSWYNKVATSATKNKDSDTLVLGRYVKDGPNSYEKIAKDNNATYFEVDDWDGVTKGLSADQTWEINKTFLKQQLESGDKKIIFSHNPNKPKDEFGGEYFEREVNLIKELGYEFRETSQGLWEAF